MMQCEMSLILSKNKYGQIAVYEIWYYGQTRGLCVESLKLFLDELESYSNSLILDKRLIFDKYIEF